MFDWKGIGNIKKLLLAQKSDPLQYCMYSIPIPTSLGIPCAPCDLPNQYLLYETDQQYSELGDIILQFQQQIDLLSRTMLPPSHRPWKMIGKDYYNHTPMIGFRDFNVCCSRQRPQIRAYLHSQYIGRIVETTVLNCCCFTEIYQQFLIYDHRDNLIFKITAESGQRSEFIILPWFNFDKLRYTITRISKKKDEQQQYKLTEQYNQESIQGEIVHLHSGLSQYTSKLDKYGITLPANSTQQQNCLIIFTTLFIEYLLFENF